MFEGQIVVNEGPMKGWVIFQLKQTDKVFAKKKTQKEHLQKIRYKLSKYQTFHFILSANILLYLLSRSVLCKSFRAECIELSVLSLLSNYHCDCFCLNNCAVLCCDNSSLQYFDGDRRLGGTSGTHLVVFPE